MERKVDQHGFPIPAKFDDLADRSKRDDDGLPALKRPSPERVLVWKRRIFWTLIVVGFFAFIGIEGRRPIANWLAETQAESGRRSLARKDYDRAKQSFEWAIWLDEKDVNFHQLLAKSLARRGEFEASYNELSAALEIKADRGENRITRSDILVQRAYLLLRMDKIDEAFAEMERAMEAGDPFSATMLNSRAYLRALANQKISAALEDLNRAIRITEQQRRTRQFYHASEYEKYFFLEGLGTMYFHRGLVHQSLDHKAKAIADFERADTLGYDAKTEGL